MGDLLYLYLCLSQVFCTTQKKSYNFYYQIKNIYLYILTMLYLTTIGESGYIFQRAKALKQSEVIVQKVALCWYSFGLCFVVVVV